MALNKAFNVAKICRVIKNKLNLLTEDEGRNEYDEIIGRFINPLEVH